jgi:RNA recognition motif-containing protein
MGKRLYVGNLPYQTDETQLRSLFEQEGRQVEEVKIVTDRETGRPRGFAFVEMATDAQALAAIESLHGKPFGGRPLTVSEARDRAPRSGGGGGGGPRGPRRE